MTQRQETIDEHLYMVTRDDQGNIIGMYGVEPWKTAPPPPPALTKFAFRCLFTLDERIAIDNFETNPNLGDEEKAGMRTYRFDFQIAEDISLLDPVTIDGVQMLEQIGLIGPGRASEVLSGIRPTIGTASTTVSTSADQ